MVKKCLPKIRDAVPATHEIVYDYNKSVVVSFSMSEKGYEALVAFAVEADKLRLYFSKNLPDPKGLLEGAGGKVRSVIIKAASDLDHADIQALFKAANKHAGGPFPKSRAPRMIINQSSEKRKKKAAAKKPRSSK